MIEIAVNGEKFSDWISADMNADLDYLCRSFSFVTAEDIAAVKANTEFDILVDGEQFAKVYADRVDKNAESNELIIDCRDIVSDIVDSSLPDDAKNSPAGGNLVELVNKVTTSLGLCVDVINEAGSIKPFSEFERTAAEAGANAYAQIEQYARKRGVYYRAGYGSLIIYRLSDVVSTDYSFIAGDNIVDVSVSLDFSGRYREYVVKSQANAERGYGDKEVYRVGRAQDDEVRGGRYLEMVASETMSAAECKERAREEANIRRARSLEVRVDVVGHSQDGKIYEAGKLASVKTGIGAEGVFLIKSVRMSDGDGGPKTTLTMTYPDAYTIEAEMSAKQAKRSDISRWREGNG